MATINSRLDKLEQGTHTQAPTPMYWVDKDPGGYVVLSDGQRVDPGQVDPEQLARCKKYGGGISPDDWD